MVNPPVGARTAGITVDDHDVLPASVVVMAFTGLVLGASLGSFGVPRLDVMWVLHQVPIMGPLCGATRAVALASVGDLRASWTFNPIGVILVVGAWGVLVRQVVGQITGRWFTPYLAARFLWALSTVTLVALTIRQQANAAYLLEHVVVP